MPITIYLLCSLTDGVSVPLAAFRVLQEAESRLHYLRKHGDPQSIMSIKEVLYFDSKDK